MPRHTRVACALQSLVQDILAPPIPITGIDILHPALLAHIRVVIALTWLDDKVGQQDGRAWGGLHALREVLALQSAVLWILFLTGVKDEDVNKGAVCVDCGFDCRGKFADGRGKEVVC